MADPLIPNQYLFVFGLREQDEPFHLCHYLCIESCYQVNRPDRILFFCQHEPWGPYWNLAKRRLTMVRIEADARKYGISYGQRNQDCRPYSYAHVADFVRLEKLLEYGGIYADIDTLFVHPPPAGLRSNPFVLGREADIICQTTGLRQHSLCNALVMAPPQAEFGRRWLEEMPKAFDGSWSNHSTLLPQRLSLEIPHALHIEPERSFYPYMWTPEDLHRLLEGCERDTSGILSIHLWSHLWWAEDRRDFSRFHQGLLTEDRIRQVDTTYSLLARPFLPARGVQVFGAEPGSAQARGRVGQGSGSPCGNPVEERVAIAGSLPDQGQVGEPLDCVYLWVDGDDPGFRAGLQHWRPAEVGGDCAGLRRFRDNGELRYSLRSLERHAPWIDRVFIVHAGQLPDWLDTAHPRLRTVHHREIFPDPSVLPTYNSCAIELNLHRIPDLSRNFLYLNDDLFFGQDTPRSWFLPQAGLPRFFFEPNPIPPPGPSSPVHDLAYAHTVRRLPWGGPRRSPAIVPSRSSWRRLLGLAPQRYLPAHIPQVYNRDGIRELEKRFPGEFRRTRQHRFRAPDDLVLRILYGYSRIRTDQIQAVLLDWCSSDYLFVRLQDDLAGTRRVLDELERLEPRFLCANDDVESREADPPTLAHWRQVLSNNYPTPSSFELAARP